MFDSSHLPLFVLASMAVLLMPGQDVLYVVARSMNQGRKAGMVAVLGVEMGTLAHIAAAALSLSAIVLSSASAFNAIKYLGAAYLIYLGIRASLERGPLAENTVKAPANLRRVCGQGVLVALFNPTTVLFFLAFLPQFVDSTRGHVAAQTWVLGLIFIGLAAVVDSGYALLAASLGLRLHRNKQAAKGRRCVAAILFIGLGVSAALTESA